MPNNTNAFQHPFFGSDLLLGLAIVISCCHLQRFPSGLASGSGNFYPFGSLMVYSESKTQPKSEHYHNTKYQVTNYHQPPHYHDYHQTPTDEQREHSCDVISGFFPRWAAPGGNARHLRQSGPFHPALEKYQICDKKTSRDFCFT